MDCLKVQAKIIDFIEDRLNDNETMDFIEHIKTCQNCAEELEVYYTLLVGMKQLDENDDLSTDFHSDLVMKIKSYESKIRVKRRLRIQFKVSIALFSVFFIIVSLNQYEKYITRQQRIEMQQSLNYDIRDYLGGYFFKENIVYFENKDTILYNLLLSD